MHCIHLYPERLALHIRRQEAELNIRCEVPGGGTGRFLISVWNRDGKLVVRRLTKSEERVTLCLPTGCCRLQVKNYSNLNPGGITKWLQLAPNTCGSLCLLFTQPLCFPLVETDAVGCDGTENIVDC